MDRQGERSLEEWRQRSLRELPPVHRLLSDSSAEKLSAEYSRELVSEAVSDTLSDLRARISAASSPVDLVGLPSEPGEILGEAAGRLRRRFAPKLRPVINATGVVLHTNLGRSVLAPEAIEAVALAASRYTNLELDLDTGERGSRYAHVEEVLRELTGAEAAMVVNNNAGAVLLVFTALARGKEVVVSRGELVEIGGSFRIPEVMEQSGARLVEVGATNKTRLSDYARAIGPETALLLKVHTSNYRIIGFSESVALNELVELGRQRGLPVIEDLGSGVFVDLARFGMDPEPTVQSRVAAGADLVTFSGDKLLGGPQAGVIVGRRRYVDMLRKHPLNRALRIDKLTLAALEGTLKLYLDPARALQRVPTLRMLISGADKILGRAEAVARTLSEALGSQARIDVVEGGSQAGGGSLPGQDLPTRLIAVTPSARPAQEVEGRLRASDPPVLVRIQRGQILIDLRTVLEDEEAALIRAMIEALR